jgi:DNA polymerase-3 subunit epsilon
MRRIVLDTETTGLEPEAGHRVIELACLELSGRRPTGRHFHRFLNPERNVDLGATQVHGLTSEDLADKPRFADIADEFLDFVGGAELLIHNADFDVAFLNAELARIGRPRLESVCTVADTLAMAREMHPGKKNSLDALCERYAVDHSRRTLHGALLDAQLLAQVYVELTGGRQIGLGLVADTISAGVRDGGHSVTVREPRLPRPHRPALDELERHRAFIAQMANPLWNRFVEAG